MHAAKTKIVSRIVSGGQTGVDRAALDWAISHGIHHGGWCPQERKAEDGTIPARYTLTETDSAGYSQRTAWNVRDSDATLILNMGELDGGTLKTTKLASKMDKPYLIVQLDDGKDFCISPVRDWLACGQYLTLNVAGPRESKRPGIYAAALRFLNHCLC